MKGFKVKLEEDERKRNKIIAIKESEGNEGKSPGEWKNNEFVIESEMKRGSWGK